MAGDDLEPGPGAAGAEPRLVAGERVAVGLLVQRYQLRDAARHQLEQLLDLLTGDPHAPTAVRDRAGAIRDHLADSLVALDVPALRSASTIADVGSGAGLPGLALAIGLPEADVVLVESNARKCAFLFRAIATCGLANAQVVQARAESWPPGLGRFDVVTARAVAPLVVVAEYAAPLLRIGGTLLAWRGRRDAAAEAAAAGAAAELGLEVDEPLRVEPYPGAQHRHLHVMLKVRSTPSGFPRREGIAAKRPLGGPLHRVGRGDGQRERSDRPDQDSSTSAAASSQPSDRRRR